MAPPEPGDVRILLIDDDEDQRRLLGASLAALRLEGVDPDVVAVAEPGAGLDHLRDGGEWIVFVDHRLGTTRSTAWLPRLVAADAGPVIVITAEGDEQLVREVYRLGASGYLAKAELLSPDRGGARRVITDARRTWGLERRARELAASLEQANAELRPRDARLGEVAAETQRFVDDVAHAFRGPLASIGCDAEMFTTAMAGPASDEQRSPLEVILRSSTNLRRLVDDVLAGGGPAPSARASVEIEVVPRDGAPAEPGPRPGAAQML